MEIKSTPFSTEQMSGIFDFFFFLFLISIFLWANTLEAGATPAEFFKDNCSSCHTIGEGELVGSDLKDIAKRREKAWLGKFIINAKGLFDAKDPIAVKLFKEPDDIVMPPFPELDEEKSLALVDYISAESKGEKSSTASPAVSVASFSSADEVPMASFSQSDVEAGMALFSGKQPLANGGPACICCHELQSAPFPGGGNLAPDLTGIFNRLGKRKGLTSWLNSPPASAMSKLFKNTPLKPEEVFSLVAVFEEATKREATERNAPLKLFLSGLGVGFSVLFLFGIFWRNRISAAGGPGFKGGKV